MAALLPLFRYATRATLPASDAELLARFAAGRDEDAFAELVHRHGPVVYRICRRLVGPGAADDAFQATFIVLATRLAAARAVGSVGGWLVGVAGRVGRQMRRAAARRARHEAIAADTRRDEPTNNAIDLADQFRVLDEELARLPDHLRDPVVLCLLQGRTQEDAAAELGHNARTLRRRLERARQMLRARLERRGVVPAVAAALVTGVGSVSASIPHALSSRTVSMVFDFLTGGAGLSRAAPVILAKGVATTMFARKLMLSMAALALGLVGFGVVLADDGQPAPAARATRAAPPVSPTPTAGAARATPVQPPLMPAVKSLADEIDWKRDEARMRARIAEFGPHIEKRDRVILMEGLCIQAEAGFCEQAGLEDDAKAWALSHREARMFSALLRVEKKIGGLNVITRPLITVGDNQTALAQLGQDVPYVKLEEAKTKEGLPVMVPKIAYRPVGVTLKVTPRIAADGLIQLRIESESSEISGTPVKLGNGQIAPAFSAQSLSTTVAVADGGTAVVRGGAGHREGGDVKAAHETLWVITAYVVRGTAKAPVPKTLTPPAPALEPAPVVEPPPAPTPLRRK